MIMKLPMHLPAELVHDGFEDEDGSRTTNNREGLTREDMIDNSTDSSSDQTLKGRLYING